MVWGRILGNTGGVGILGPFELPARLMAGRQVLALLIEVRILGGQPSFNFIAAEKSHAPSFHFWSEA